MDWLVACDAHIQVHFKEHNFSFLLQSCVTDEILESLCSALVWVTAFKLHLLAILGVWMLWIITYFKIFSRSVQSQSRKSSQTASTGVLSPSNVTTGASRNRHRCQRAEHSNKVAWKYKLHYIIEVPTQYQAHVVHQCTYCSEDKVYHLCLVQPLGLSAINTNFSFLSFVSFLLFHLLFFPFVIFCALWLLVFGNTLKMTLKLL